MLNVGAAHAQTFGSRQATAHAKGELVEALGPDGVAVLNADDALVAAMATRSAAPVVTVGRAAGARIRAENVHLDPAARPSFRLLTPAGQAPVSLLTHGEHHVANALSAAAVGLEAGLGIEEVAAALSTATPASRWRMEVRTRNDGVVVVNDAYNANPDSVRAALHAVAAMTGTGRGWAVLGEMLELGSESLSAHQQVGQLAAELGLHGVLAVGPGAQPIADGAAAAGAPAVHAVPGPDEAAALLAANLRPNDIVLIKASRAVGLERLAELLQLHDDTDLPQADAIGGVKGA